MTIRDLVQVLDAQVLRGEDRLDTPVYSACCSDLMSDVLAFVNEKTVLLTGLCNLHVVRTAEMLDLKCLIFVRGKLPDDAVLDRADELHLAVLSTDKTMFSSAGLLYEAGLRGAAMQWGEGREVEVS